MVIADSLDMPRLARIVIPGIPHHITQRGNRKQTTFFEREDYLAYKDCLRQSCRQYHVSIWSYCLMPNHVHLIAVPFSEASLSKAMGRGHEMYSRYINFRKGWRGLLWQSRFKSFPMDEVHLHQAAHYVELNPVRARLVESPEDYEWSSARAHLGVVDDEFVHIEPLLQRIPDWRSFLFETTKAETTSSIEQHIRSGRPLASVEFITDLEERTGRILKPRKPGPKPKK